MTRSEELQLAISIARENVKSLKLHHISEPKIAQLTLDLLLAEQKRSEGCLYCCGDMVDGYALENMYGKYPKIVGLSMKNHRSGDQLPISFCPNCGRNLNSPYTEGEKE